jgi:hypothetical protein
MVRDIIIKLVDDIHNAVNGEEGVKALLAKPVNDGDVDKADSATGNNKATTRISQQLFAAKTIFQNLAANCIQDRKQVIALGKEKKGQRKVVQPAAQAPPVEVPPPPAE